MGAENEVSRPRGPVDWEGDPVEDLARELRQSVGAEMRAEAEIAEAEVRVGRLRRRTLADVALEAAHRGDRVTAVVSGRTVSGTVAHVGRDYLVIETGSEVVDLSLQAGLLTVSPSTTGGFPPQRGSVTLRARLSEYEQTGERVELVLGSVDAVISGVIQVVATDHLLLQDQDGVQTVVPLEVIDMAVRSLPGAPR